MNKSIFKAFALIIFTRSVFSLDIKTASFQLDDNRFTKLMKFIKTNPDTITAFENIKKDAENVLL
jgi:hypothetical protein